MENAIRYNKTPEERKEALEEALRRGRQGCIGHKETVGKRMEAFSNHPIGEQNKNRTQIKDLKQLSLTKKA